MLKRAVEWRKCGTGTWCELATVDLNHADFNNLEGVYIIWYLDAQGQPVVVKVGQGGIDDLADKNNGIRGRLKSHRSDKEIQAYAKNGLKVTWAEVLDDDDRNGIERFLGNQYKPFIGDRFPAVNPIPVNLPDLGAP